MFWKKYAETFLNNYSRKRQQDNTCFNDWLKSKLLKQLSALNFNWRELI